MQIEHEPASHEQILAMMHKHMPGQHDQKSHNGGKSSTEATQDGQAVGGQPAAVPNAPGAIAAQDNGLATLSPAESAAAKQAFTNVKAAVLQRVADIRSGQFGINDYHKANQEAVRTKRNLGKIVAEVQSLGYSDYVKRQPVKDKLIVAANAVIGGLAGTLHGVVVGAPAVAAYSLVMAATAAKVADDANFVAWQDQQKKTAKAFTSKNNDEEVQPPQSITDTLAEISELLSEILSSLKDGSEKSPDFQTLENSKHGLDLALSKTKTDNAQPDLTDMNEQQPVDEEPTNDAQP